MKISATFCISHGDEMKLCEMSTHAELGELRYPMMAFDWHVENMAAHLITEALRQQGEGSFSPRLVTHPEDR